MGGVETLEVVVGEGRDVDRIAAAVVVVGARGEQGGAERAVEPRRLAAHGTLHLVEHDTLELQRRALIFHVLELEPVSFLEEVLPGELGEEGGVEVDAEEVVVVRPVHGGERVAGEVRGGHGVHERAQRPAEHVEERISDGVPIAAAQGGVFQDVRDAGVVRGGGAECDVEDVVGIVGAAVHPPRAGLEVHELDARDVVLRDLVHCEHLEGAVRELGAGLERGDGGDGGSHRGVGRGRGLDGASLLVPEVAHLRGGHPRDAPDEDGTSTDAVTPVRGRERADGVAPLESRGDA